MSDLKHKLVDPEQLLLLQKSLVSKIGSPVYLQEKHQLVYETEMDTTIKLRLPIHWSCDETLLLTEVDERPYILLIVESGHAALAYGEGEHIIEHKVFKAYMVRKKQGKSQLKHLKTKGKSKAGSRVRLANTLHFFEEIHEKVTDWLSYFEVAYIALSCAKSLYSHLFTEDFDLDRHDPRIVKIPKHIQEANFENLLAIHRYLLQSELIYEEADSAKIKKILESIKTFD